MKELENLERDYLTNLPNRRSLYQYYLSLDNEGIVHAMFLDVDNFKRVNDVYGHSMGDALLISIATFLQENIKGFISRIGGDEFVILLDGDTNPEDIPRMAENLLTGFKEMDFRKDILSMISLSIGVILNQPVFQSLDDVLSKCDIAMYQAKYNGKNRYTVYKAHDTVFEVNRNIESEMETALEQGQFQVYLQPKVNMVSTKLVGAEALSRWVHPIDGIRAPMYYIPIFEKNGFISLLDMYMFEEVCKIKASWVGEVYEHIPVSINISRLHLYNKNFPEILEEMAGKYGVPTNELELEITEGTFIKDSVELIEMVTRLKEKGFLTSIDDFGSGFSALCLLKDLPVDIIKIDKGFIQESTHDFKGRKVLRNVIAMCKDLKLDVVTEGVELKAQVDYIVSCGCQVTQGYYYSKPVPEPEFRLFAEEYLGGTLENYTFRLNGDLKSEDGSLEGEFVGEGMYFEEGIFSNAKALHFSGGLCEHNYVEIPMQAIVNDSYTISMWIRPHENHIWTSALYMKYETGFCTLCPLAWEGHSDFRIRDSKEVNGWYDISGMCLKEDTWWHYTFSYNAKTETAVTFINGEVVGVMENVPTNRYVKRIMLGGDVYQQSFKGDICEMVIYNEAKDYDFVRELHQSYTSNEHFIGFALGEE